MMAQLRKLHDALLAEDAAGSLGEKPAIEFLIEALKAIPSLTKPNELAEALKYFRKWKIWLIAEQNFYFYPDVSIPSSHFSKRKPVTSGRVADSPPTPMRTGLPTPYDHPVLQALTESVEPLTTQRSTEVGIIDQGFIRNSTAYQDLEKADVAFREGKILQCHQGAIEVIDLLTSSQQLDRLHWYFLAWALHTLGKVFILRTELGYARDAFRLSAWFKEKLVELPELNYLATEAKWQFSSWMLNRGTNLPRATARLRSKLSDNPMNTNWAKNLNVDLLLNSAAYGIHHRPGRTPLEHISQAQSLAKEIGDNIGFIRGAFYGYLLSHDDKAFRSSVEPILTNLAEKDVCHPYLRAMLSLVQCEVGVELSRSEQKVFSNFFKANNVLSFEHEELRYSTRNLRRELRISFETSGRTIDKLKGTL